MPEKEYWCHVCGENCLPNFDTIDMTCPVCESDFIEEIDNEDHPENFIPDDNEDDHDVNFAEFLPGGFPTHNNAAAHDGINQMFQQMFSQMMQQPPSQRGNNNNNNNNSSTDHNSESRTGAGGEQPRVRTFHFSTGGGSFSSGQGGNNSNQQQQPFNPLSFIQQLMQTQGEFPGNPNSSSNNNNNRSEQTRESPTHTASDIPSEHQGHNSGDRNINSEPGFQFEFRMGDQQDSNNPMLMGIASLLASSLRQQGVNVDGEGGIGMGGGNPLFQLFGGVGDQGDYAFGEGAFQDIISQLMSQSGSNAPPPATEEQIAGLKKRFRTDKDEKDCSICQDEISEEGTSLPCNHLYHPNCIEYWLKLHGTCPICRYNLVTGKYEDGKTDYQDGNVNHDEAVETPTAGIL